MIQINEPLDRGWIVSLLAEGYDTYQILKNYQVNEEVIYDCMDLLDKNVIFEGVYLTENFVRKAIENKHFNLEDITNLSMGTYINLSSDFIVEFGQYINWNRMILYLSTQSNSFDKYVEIIDKNNLWSIISANDLEINFVRQWKEKLDWKLLSMTKCFSDEEKEEFSDYILVPESKQVDGDFIDKSQFEFVKKMSDEELEELIEAINNDLQNRIPGWPKS